MEASVDPQCRGPDWMPITPKTGSLFHAETQSAGDQLCLSALNAFSIISSTGLSSAPLAFCLINSITLRKIAHSSGSRLPGVRTLCRALPKPSRDRPGAFQRFSHGLPPACAASPVLTDAFNRESGDCSNIERERPSLRRRFRRMRSSQPLPPVSSRSHQYLRPPP